VDSPLRHTPFWRWREEPLRTIPPRRRIVARSVVGNLDPTPTAGLDGVDLVVTVGSVLAGVGYLLAAGRVGRLVVVRSVVGELDSTPPVGLIVQIS